MGRQTSLRMLAQCFVLSVCLCVGVCVGVGVGVHIRGAHFNVYARMAAKNQEDHVFDLR